MEKDSQTNEKEVEEKPEGFEEFEELLHDFIDNNLTTDCKMCHEQGTEIVSDDHKGSYQIALNKLFSELSNSMKSDLSTKQGIKKILVEFPDTIRGKAEHIYGMDLKKGELISINKTIEYDLIRSIKAEKENVEVEVKATAAEKKEEGYKAKFETISKTKYTNEFQRESAVNTRLLSHKEYTSNNASIDHTDKDIGTAKIELSFLKRMHESSKYLAMMGAD